jgi:hypothetical protein
MKKMAGFMMVVLAGCIDPYQPPEIKSAGAVLVIDGHADPQNRSVFTLTKSQNLFENKPAEKVTGAELWVEGESGSRYPLHEEAIGNYVLPVFNYKSERHRLFVRTHDSKEYASDFIVTKNSPPIDSISWKVSSDLGVDIYVNTHDTETTVGYYRWKFEETWEYTSAFQSIYVYDFSIRNVKLREDDIFHCWQKNNSTDILVSSTNRLSQNRISEFQLTYIPQRAERLRYTYSIQVKQFAITGEAYAYWQQLKKTTEDLGTLFGPLPSQVTGNFRCLTNPDEPVLGFFSMGSTSEKRIFINSLQVPRPNSYLLPYEECELFELPLSDVSTFPASIYLFAGGIPSPTGPGIIGYYYSVPRCIDCRLSGGTNVKPNYWP